MRGARHPWRRATRCTRLVVKTSRDEQTRSRKLSAIFISLRNSGRAKRGRGKGQWIEKARRSVVFERSCLCRHLHQPAYWSEILPGLWISFGMNPVPPRGKYKILSAIQPSYCKYWGKIERVALGSFAWVIFSLITFLVRRIERIRQISNCYEFGLKKYSGTSRASRESKSKRRGLKHSQRNFLPWRNRIGKETRSLCLFFF